MAKQNNPKLRNPVKIITAKFIVTQKISNLLNLFLSVSSFLVCNVNESKIIEVFLFLIKAVEHKPQATKQRKDAFAKKRIKNLIFRRPIQVPTHGQ